MVENESRPAADGPARKATADGNSCHIDDIASIAGWHSRREQDMRFWFGRGFTHGWDCGRAFEKNLSDREFLTHGRTALDGGPSFDALVQRRGTLPEQMPICGCGRCSVCIRQAVVRRNGGDFVGTAA